MKKEIRSKPKILKIGLALFVTVLIFGGLGILIIIMLIDEYLSGKPISYVGMFISPLFFAFVGYTFHVYFINFPILILNKKGIKIKRLLKSKFYEWREINDIELIGSKPRKIFLTNYLTEAATLKFNDGSEFYFWVDDYRNSHEIRFALNKILNSGEENELIYESNHSQTDQQLHLGDSLSKQKREVFNINHLLTFEGIIFYFITLMYLFVTPFLIINKVGVLPFFIFTCFYLVFAAKLSLYMHYFIIDKDKLIIKNSIWFWRKKCFSLNQIKEIIFESSTYLVPSLRILTNDFHDKVYPSNTLKNKTWKKLKDSLEKKNVRVRDELGL